MSDTATREQTVAELQRLVEYWQLKNSVQKMGREAVQRSAAQLLEAYRALQEENIALEARCLQLLERLEEWETWYARNVETPLIAVAGCEDHPLGAELSRL